MMKRVPLNHRRKVRRVPPSSFRPSPGTAAANHSESDLKEAARLLSILRAGGDVRSPVVSHVRESVEESVYENDLKLSIAVDRIASEI